MISSREKKINFNLRLIEDLTPPKPIQIAHAYPYQIIYKYPTPAPHNTGLIENSTYSLKKFTNNKHEVMPYTFSAKFLAYTICSHYRRGWFVTSCHAEVA